jgi:hypothetical protein
LLNLWTPLWRSPRACWRWVLITTVRPFILFLLTPTLYVASELKKCLTAIDERLTTSLSKSSLVYIPLLRSHSTNLHHKVVRLVAGEAYPIPTYGRVLFSVPIEVLDTVEKERKKEKKKKSKKESEIAELSSETLPEIRLDNAPGEKPLEDDSKDAEATLRALEKLEKKEKKHKKKKHLDELMASDKLELLPGSPPRPPTPALDTVIVNTPVGSFNSSNSGLKSPNSKSLTLKTDLELHHPTHHKTLGYHPAFQELWDQKAGRLKKLSPYGHLDGWRMQQIIVKSGEEVLQEEFAMQLIIQFQRIFEETALPVKLLP